MLCPKTIKESGWGSEKISFPGIGLDTENTSEYFLWLILLIIAFLGSGLLTFNCRSAYCIFLFKCSLQLATFFFHMG
jgi:hypothetical protein